MIHIVLLGGRINYARDFAHVPNQRVTASEAEVVWEIKCTFNKMENNKHMAVFIYLL